MGLRADEGWNLLISSSAYPSARGLLPQQTFDLSSKVRDKGGMRLPRRRAIEPGVHPLDPSVPPDEQGGRIRHEVHQLRLRRLLGRGVGETGEEEGPGEPKLVAEGAHHPRIDRGVP